MKTKKNIFGLIIVVVVLFIKCSIPIVNDKTIGDIVEDIKTIVIKEKTNNPFDKYKIDVSEGKTEIEKTVIIRFNNYVETISELIYKGETFEFDRNDILEFRLQNEEFLSFLSANAMNISESLCYKIIIKSEGISDEIDSIEW